MPSYAKFDKWYSRTGSPNNTIIQVKHQAFTAGLVTTSTLAWANIESLTITPFQRDSKILVIANYGASGTGAIRLVRNGVTLTGGNPLINQTYQHYENDSASQVDHNAGSLRTQFTLMLLDSPNSIEPVTYTTQIVAYNKGTGSGYSVQAIPPYTASPNTFSGFTLMEVTQ